MSNDEWWAAERKAAEFWRKVRENQVGGHGSNKLNHKRVAAPIARKGESGTPTHLQIPGYPIVRDF